MGPNIKHPNDDSSSTDKITNKDSKKQSKKGSRVKDSASSPTSNDLGSPESAPTKSPKPPPPSVIPSKPPPQLSLSPPPPISKDITPSPLPKLSPSPSPPPPSPSPSPPPPSPSPSPPPPPSVSPPPPPPQPPPPLQNGNSSTPPTNFTRKKSSASPPPPPFRAPPPLDRLSSSPRSHGAPSNDSAPGPSGKSISSGLGSGSNYQPMQGGGFQPGPSKGSSPSSSSGDNPGKYVGYTLAGVFVVALVAVAVTFAFSFRRRKSRGDLYGSPYIPSLDNNFRVKSGADGHYYVQQLGPQPSLYGKGNVSMKHVGAPFDSAQPKSAQIVFTYDMVMEITNAFSSHNVIGEGGFGCVYKGYLPDGKIVAVKQLRAGSGQGDREFSAEVEIISRVHHRHLVSLVGYCITEQQRVLIYEYVPNGTLHHHLHGRGMPVLDWAKRLKIAIGAAKGLAYLHEDCSQKIIHRDIKSANILLDDAFEAQVADFGLARLADASHTHVSTRVMGTFGYMAPEYATSGKLTDRSDVFSFGVVLLELVTGRKPVDQTQPLGDESLVEWARPLLHHAIETRDFNALIDPRLEKHFVESEMFRMIEAAAACVRHSAPKRPRMVQVVRALDSGDEVFDLSNGVKYGHSTVYDSGQYDRDIILFRRMANGSFADSDFDMYSRESSFSRETSRGSQHAWMRSSSSGESETRAFNRHRSSTE